MFERRLQWFSGMIGAVALVILLRLVDLQYVRAAEYEALADRLLTRPTSYLTAPRGTIHDRHGRALAQSVEVDSLYAVPSSFTPERAQEAAGPIARCLGLPKRKVLGQLQGRKDFAWLERKAGAEARRCIEALNVSGVHSVEESRRFYPKRRLAAQVLGYVGIDNRAAGLTAAYLLSQWLGDRPGNVLVTMSSSAFRGEEEREAGFRAAIRRDHPHRRIREISESDGLDATMRRLVRAALEADRDIVAVYSIGGGNVATVETFESVGLPPPVFIGHDVDDDNRDLLRRGRISAVLHHDLGHDVRRACQLIMQAQEALPGLGGVATGPSPIQVVTPYNLPVPTRIAGGSPRARR